MEQPHGFSVNTDFLDDMDSQSASTAQNQTVPTKNRPNEPSGDDRQAQVDTGIKPSFMFDKPISADTPKRFVPSQDDFSLSDDGYDFSLSDERRNPTAKKTNAFLALLTTMPAKLKSGGSWLFERAKRALLALIKGVQYTYHAVRCIRWTPRHLLLAASAVVLSAALVFCATAPIIKRPYIAGRTAFNAENEVCERLTYDAYGYVICTESTGTTSAPYTVLSDYDGDRLIRETKQYRDGTNEITTYHYEGDRLKTAVTTNLLGEIINTRSYYYNKGLLRASYLTNAAEEILYTDTYTYEGNMPITFTRLNHQTNLTVTTTYTYNDGRLTQRTDASGNNSVITVTYHYNKEGLLQSTSAPASYADNLHYTYVYGKTRQTIFEVLF